MTFNPSLSSALGSKLSQLRRKRGLTLDGLAELSLVSRAAISALEQGNGNPRVQTLWNLADALGVNFSTLLDDTTETIVSDEDGIRVRLLERQTSPRWWKSS
ncbi:helix-turn-helix domain-containing protein [Paracoccus kondratievae]